MAQTWLSEAEALAIMYCALFVFACVAALAVPLIYRKFADQSTGADAADFWYSARNSQGWVSIGLSIFSSSAGAWMLFAAPEVGAVSGWWGAIGYAVGIIVAPMTMCVLAPKVRACLADGVTLSDWVRERFGVVVHVYVGIVGVFYLWVYMVAELTSMGNLIRSFSGLHQLHALLPVSIVTMLYTMVGGLPASIWTDRVQGVIMVVCIIIVCVACFSSLDVPSDRWSQVATWTDRGFETLVTLTLAIFGAEIFNMSTWQRVYAAKNERELWKGLCAGSAAIAVATLLFGICGMLAEAANPAPIKALSFFQLLDGRSKAIQGLVYMLVTCMVASSVDSLQTGIVSVLSKTIMRRKLSPWASTGIGQLLVLAVNVFAIAWAAAASDDMSGAMQLKILDLFLIADVVMITLPFPIFMGLWPFVTSRGVLAGMASGLLTVLLWGWIEFGTMMAGFEMITLMSFGNTPTTQSGLSARRTPIMFCVIPLITLIVTYAVSWLDNLTRMAAVVAAATAEGKLAPTDTEKGEAPAADPCQVRLETILSEESDFGAEEAFDRPRVQAKVDPRLDSPPSALKRPVGDTLQDVEAPAGSEKIWPSEVSQTPSLKQVRFAVDERPRMARTVLKWLCPGCGLF